ncbi:MAG TPA: hypothetical protein P5205_03405 [Candidatus Paceibacterota bacterium]|nr:hypothetical protein [Verrucomicrobiota bacterium]HSA09397.1 hypothetical protein [Candidatus Paceibacterota bacterium]
MNLSSNGLSSPCDRRTFIKSTSALAGLALWPMGALEAAPDNLILSPRKKKPALIRGAFFYPPAEVVIAGKNEDGWQQHEWFTWPGNQFEPEQQQRKFLAQLNRLTAGLDLTIDLEEQALYTDAGIRAFLASLESNKPDALLLFNFWNSFSQKMLPIFEAWKGPIILYHPVGASHQAPPEYLRTAPRVQYIHSIENWDALERGLRAVHAMNRMAQSRLLRVASPFKERHDTTEPFFGLAIRGVPADEFNHLFDETRLTREMERLAKSVRSRARHITDLSPTAFHDAVRSHAAVQKIMERHDADAITIECLMLKHRKPCLSFALNNGTLRPCGCENDLNASLTLMLGANCFGRGGFQHNPEFDTEQNLYFGAHCTCTTRLHGPQGKETPYSLRPFFHQLPKTLALDVQWPVGETVTLCKYHSGKKQLDAWRGQLVSSPTCPPTGGCATRVLVKVPDVKDICTIYGGPHPILYCGDFAAHLKTLARLYELEVRGNC